VRVLRLFYLVRLLRLLCPVHLLGLLRGTAGPRIRPWRTRLPCWRCSDWCCPLYRLPTNRSIPRCSSACSTTNSPYSCSMALLIIMPSPRLDGLPRLYRLEADRSENCPTRGTRHGGGNFFCLGEVYPYCVREHEEFAMGHLIPSLGGNSGGEATKYRRTQRFVALALRKIFRYP
jgi:hypothetical protein